MTTTGTILDRIVAATRGSLGRRTKLVPLAEVEATARQAGLPRDFAGALRRRSGIALIAEIKRASPSKGGINEALDVAKLSASYESGGAAAISVLTEPVFFHGSFLDLEHARKAVDLPVLCKDFILTPYQIYEARCHRADAVLLIAAVLDGPALRELAETARSLGMAALIETHSEAEVDKALSAGARIVGINNRNLADFSVDLNTTSRLRPRVPSWLTVVSESGIRCREDVRTVEQSGANAVLVGESLVKAADPAAQVRSLLGGKP